ncbi:hypothetical protein TKK_0003572 [Trichogramma kaykai]|uniref:Uncharacterized protein n=1 Tax=Trichogramma kaykai TaxID=54128 RepID=A0ABD2XRA2_9HYME
MLSKYACGTNAFLRLIALATLCLNLTQAGTRYIAIPIDNVDIIELDPVPSYPSRFPRQADTSYATSSSLQQQQQYPHNHQYHHHHHREPVGIIEQPQPQQQVAAASNPLVTKHILDYVDFGAHTGPNGAFSWYADYPTYH